MTKQQKIWLWIGLCLAFVPEILWSPVGNYALQYIRYSNHYVPIRNSWLLGTDNMNWLSIIIFIQFVGLALLTFVGFKLTRQPILKWVIGIASILLCLFVFLLFGLSVSLRSIGF